MKKTLFLSIATLFAASAASAAPVTVNGGTVNFNGEIVNAACAVGNDSLNQTVTLGQFRTTKFKTTGDQTDGQQFKINLVDCDPTVSQTAKIAFKGSSIAGQPELLSLIAGNGGNGSSAKGVGIEISDAQGTAMKLDGSNATAASNLLQGQNEFTFVARYKSYADAAGVVAGPANGVANFEITYE